MMATALAVWKSIDGTGGLYEVSSLGEIRRTTGIDSRGRHWMGRTLKPQLDKRGYLNVCISLAGVVRKRRVHVMVCEAFHGPRPEGKEAAHINGVRVDCRSDNLEWKTHTENEADKIVHGTIASGTRHGSRTKPERTRRGVSHGMAKLTEQDVLQIRRLLESKSAYSIAKEYKVVKNCILNIKHRRSWSHI